MLKPPIVHAFVISSLLLQTAARAEEAAAPPASPKPSPAATPISIDVKSTWGITSEEVKQKGVQAVANESENTKKFAGFSFGVGIGATLIHRARDARIDEAELVGEPQVVRVKKRTRVPTRLLLESHYFGTLDKEKRYGLGPFLAIQAGSQDVVEAIGFGLMLGLRRGTSANSFNLGLGGLVDASSPVLGKGIVEGQPLPAGEAAVRLQQRSVFSWLLMFSFSF